MKIEQHYILQTKLTSCSDNRTELAVTYFKRILKTALNMLQRGQCRPGKG